MGGLCGGAHEMSGIPAPIWLRGWVVGRIMGWVVVMWVVVGVGYYKFPRSTNKIKSFDEISTPEKNYIFLHFSVVGEGQT